MTSFLTEFVFVGLIAGMLLLLAALQFIAKYISQIKTRAISFRANQNFKKPSAKIISLPQKAMRPGNERFLVSEPIAEEEIV